MDFNIDLKSKQAVSAAVSVKCTFMHTYMQHALCAVGFWLLHWCFL